MSGETSYYSWTKTGLIHRLKELEAELKRRPAAQPEASVATLADDRKREGAVASSSPQDAATPGTVGAKKPKEKRKVDPSKYATRYIALKLAYLGKNYGGFEFQAMGNQPSIEEELWNALTKACLIFPQDERIVDFDCCEYSKCGRTDRGVSAFGQVIGVRVRSNRPLPKKLVQSQQEDSEAAIDSAQSRGPSEGDQTQGEFEVEKPFDPIRDELHYPRLLNRVLPPDIRVLAWCPSPPPDFSARFSCRERQYRYFFTLPAFVPDPTASPSGSGGRDGIRPGWLDIDAMRDAARRFEGEHDFRNFCKIDASKQISNFSRRIFEASIEEVKDVSSALPFLDGPDFAQVPQQSTETSSHPKVFSFNVRGSAFLWHQIRHMVGILFLVGQRLEAPSLVTDLLDVQKHPGKPSYNMADEVPLVLWDCIFPTDLNPPPNATALEDSLEWVYVGEGSDGGKFGQHGVVDNVWQTWRGRKMDELLANQLLQHISHQGHKTTPTLTTGKRAGGGSGINSARLFEGGDTGRMGGKYVPVLKKQLQPSPEEQNDRYAKRKGYTDAEDMRTQKGMRIGYTQDTAMQD